MADETAGLFHLEDDVDSTDVNPNSNHQIMKNEENQWIDELRVALDRECDLGSIRNIVQCRPLIDDLRLRAWKVRQTVRMRSAEKTLFFERFVLV